MHKDDKIRLKIAKGVKEAGPQGLEWTEAKELDDTITEEALHTFTAPRSKLSELVYVRKPSRNPETYVLEPYEKLYYMDDESEIKNYLE